MILYLIRHAIAADAATPDADDSQRPLTAKGRRKMHLIAQELKALEVDLDLILTSPYLRAAETAEILAETFRLKKSQVIASDHLAPIGHADQLVNEVREKHGDVRSLAIVGHEPYLSGLASVLIAGDPNVSIALKKGGVCRLAVDDLRYGRCAILEWLLPPKLAKIAP